VIFRIGALLLVAAGAWLLTQLAPTLSVQAVLKPTTEAPAQPAYYLREVDVDEFGEDGGLRLRLRAAEASETPGSGAIEARTVKLDYLALPGQAWQLEAASGTVQQDRKQVQLAGDVTMTGHRDGQPGRAIVRTDRMTLDLETHRALTTSPVTVSFGRHELNALGMLADLKAETLQLESSVNGQFTP
jgi:LPS export ABC transporter protein LptC